MPTVRIFGQEVERKRLLIGGGLIAAAVAVIVFLRARAASQAASQAAGVPAPQPDQGQSAGGGMAIPAPSGQVADQYQQQLDNAQLQAQTIANTYQSNLVTQQQKQFDFQQKEAAALEPSFLAREQSELAVQTHYNKTVANTRISCPGGQGVAQAPDGSLYCRQKTSGGFLGIPLGDIVRTVQNFVGGVEAAAPSLGYQTAQQAAAYYTGKAFPTRTVAPSSGNPSARPVQRPYGPTPPVYTPGIAPHGYGDTEL